MKRIFIFVIFSVLVLFSLNSMSYGVTMLNLSLHNGERFSVVFNNNAPSGFVNEYESPDLTSGQYFLQVTVEINSPYAAESTIFSDYINLVDGYKIYAVINADRMFFVYKKVIYNGIPGIREYHYKCKCNCECCKNCPECNPDININTNENDWECRHKSITENDFNNLKETVAKRSFEETKKELVISAIDNNYFTSAKVKEILGLFDYDNTKLEVAKYAYKKTCDRKNYFVVYDVFTFESTISELKKYIEGSQ